MSGPTAVVLAFDRLPLRLLGCYGNRWSETPQFNRLAAESAVFHGHFAENLRTAATDHAWWTGRQQFCVSQSPPAQPAGNPRWRRWLDSILSLFGVGSHGRTGMPAWVTALNRHGVITSLLREPQAEHPMAPGCAECVVSDPEGKHPQPTPMHALIEKAAALLAGLRSRREPWLLWLAAHGVDNDIPATVDERDSHAAMAESAGGEEHRTETPKSHGLRRQTAVASAVAELDRGLGRLLDSLAEWDPVDGPLLIVTAAEGLPVGERDDAPGLCGRVAEEFAHTPLFIRHPAIRTGIHRQELVQTIDLVPTVNDWFGAPGASPTLPGISLLPLVCGESPDWREHICLGDGEHESIRTTEFCLVRRSARVEGTDRPDGEDRPAAMLFVKPDDAWEIHNVAAQSPDDVELLTELLDELSVEMS